MRPVHPTLPRDASQQAITNHGYRTNQTFQPLPAPSGAAPYRLDLETVLGADKIAAIRTAGGLIWHSAGDVGGVKSPQSQQAVADVMAQDYVGTTPPAFLYLLGDVVYYNGERADYFSQFYDPYGGYPAPIMAIPGNHDGDPLPGGEPSLAAFASNFCAAMPTRAPEAQETQRDTMVQPNVYWTLTAPFLTIIGLYSNVPEGGRFDDQQIAWLHAELAAAPTEGALVVAVHHPPYSADAFHGGSAYVGGVLDAAFTASGRTPDLVLSGHVHNYQRFSRVLGAKTVPYVVAGSGGYWHLHAMAKDNGAPLPTPWPVPNQTGVALESYAANHHGYLRLTATATQLVGEYVTASPVAVADTVTVELHG